MPLVPVLPSIDIWSSVTDNRSGADFLRVSGFNCCVRLLEARLAAPLRGNTLFTESGVDLGEPRGDGAIKKE